MSAVQVVALNVVRDNSHLLPKAASLEGGTAKQQDTRKLYHAPSTHTRRRQDYALKCHATYTVTGTIIVACFTSIVDSSFCRWSYCDYYDYSHCTMITIIYFI